MKKYVKPELFYESFELSQQIAACRYDSNNTYEDTGCKFTGINDFGMTTVLFMEAPSCDTQPEFYCYHNATTSPFGIFNS